MKYSGRDDLAVLALAEGAQTVAVFTRNRFRAAPVQVAQRHLQQAAPRFLVINAGNANAGTGARGLEDARNTCAAVARAGGCRVEEVLPFSTGVIGEPLEVDAIVRALPGALTSMSDDNWNAAARAIMTTDSVVKTASRTVRIGAETITVSGIAKGAGMICPDMATLLAFVATDARVAERGRLAGLWEEVVQRSFNAITVDGDTSTNDAAVLIATGATRGPALDRDETSWPVLAGAVEAVAVSLAEQIVRDGEGATKFVRVSIEQGADQKECRQVARTIAHSLLVKTAFYASDANWGRILAAVGRAGIDDLDISRVHIFLNEVCVVAGGERAAGYTEAQGAAVMAQAEITVRVKLGRGQVCAQVLTCDLSHEYVRINAEYRS